MKIIIVGTYLPRKCGIATFTHDLYKSLVAQGNEVEILAISDETEGRFPPEVKHIILRNELSNYTYAGKWISKQYDACIIQHEFGIFGGDSGAYIQELINHLTITKIVNLHTVLMNPSLAEKNAIQKIAETSDHITVMTNRAIDMLQHIYQVPSIKISHIPHGVPQFKTTPQQAKERLGFEGKTVMLSFGLLGRSKGFETAIEAVSMVKEPNFLYVILGATHPNVVRDEGESYRQELIQLAASKGLSGQVIFVDRYVNDELLEIYLKACDIYVTPYPNENQISSGTLSFAMGAGAAVISTPYWYAKDLLQKQRGLLFDFNRADQLASCIQNLIDNPESLKKYRKKALTQGNKMSWKNVAKMQMALINKLNATSTLKRSKNKLIQTKAKLFKVEQFFPVKNSPLKSALK